MAATIARDRVRVWLTRQAKDNLTFLSASSRFVLLSLVRRLLGFSVMLFDEEVEIESMECS